MKTIGIVTFHRSHNYGSVLLAYAMARTLSSLGLKAAIIDYRHHASELMYGFVWWDSSRTLRQNIHHLISHGILGRGRRRRRVFDRFITEKLPLTRRYSDRSEINEHFDYLVCGSDQIWNPDAPDSRDDIYFLDFGDADTVKFSYAASSGSRKFFAVDKARTGHFLSSLKRIGVREQFMKDYISSTFGLESTVNPDPTLLLTQEEWSVLEEEVPGLPSGFILVYSLLDTLRSVETASGIGSILDLPVVHLNHRTKARNNFAEGAGISLFDVSPGQFLWLIRRASFVVSNSFHGNMFSIIYRKDFVCPVFDFRDQRIETLHERVGLGRERFVSSARDFVPSLRYIDYGPLEAKIATFRKEGIDFIKDCL